MLNVVSKKKGAMTLANGKTRIDLIVDNVSAKFIEDNLDNLYWDKANKTIQFGFSPKKKPLSRAIWAATHEGREPSKHIRRPSRNDYRTAFMVTK
jgi:hypothetical protein